MSSFAERVVLLDLTEARRWHSVSPAPSSGCILAQETPTVSGPPALPVLPFVPVGSIDSTTHIPALHSRTEHQSAPEAVVAVSEHSEHSPCSLAQLSRQLAASVGAGLTLAVVADDSSVLYYRVCGGLAGGRREPLLRAADSAGDAPAEDDDL
eukprot:m51a1_g13363 hypothetical protein (153) ;mRNA; f:882-1340